MKLAIPLLFFFALALAFANTPGQHSVTLTWTEANCPSCTFNVYRGSATGVCKGVVTPYAKGITLDTYQDTAVQPGSTYVYAVSAVNGGVESSCSAELQIALQPSPSVPTNLQGVAN